MTMGTWRRYSNSLVTGWSSISRSRGAQVG